MKGLRLAGMVAGLFWGWNAVCAEARVAPVVVSIPGSSLNDALKQLARQAGFQVVFYSTDSEGLTTRPLSGKFTARQALTQLLAGTGLTYRYISENTVAIVGSEGADRGTPSVGAANATDAAADSSSMPIAGTAISMLLSQSDTSSPVNPPSPKEEGWEEDRNTIQEVIVTAQKREERLQDVPESITVLNPQVLAESGQARLVDYFASVPGLIVAPDAGYGGMQYITIRGLSAGSYQNPIVSTVIDDVPTTASVSASFGGFTAPDLDPSDLARIEVLKGPQGTLYGADNLGGLIKYVTTDPSTSRLSGRVQVTGVDIPGGGTGYTVRAALNVPVSDTLALRLSGFDRHDPGYIDDLTTGQKNFNSDDVYGGHLGVLWRPMENLSVKLSTFIQQSEGNVSFYDSTPTGQSIYNDLNTHSLPGTTGYTTQDQLFSLTVDWKIAGIDIFSASGYVVNKLANYNDSTTGFGQAAYDCQREPDPTSQYYCALPPGTPSGRDGVSSYIDVITRKPSEELRFSSSIGSSIEWRLGGFYTHEAGPPAISASYGANPVTGAIEFPLYVATNPTQTFSEYAVFGDVTTHLTDRFDIDFGGRDSWNRQANQVVVTGIATKLFTQASAPDIQPLLQASGSAFTYQIAPRFKITPDRMAYARIATGYRIGGYNQLTGLPATDGIPASYAPDKTTNYEIGIKGDLLAHQLSFDVALYDINWNNFQTTVFQQAALPDGTIAFDEFTKNAGKAKSEGLEFSVEAHPLQGLTTTAQGSYEDAVLTQSLPSTSAVYGPKNTQLPYSMRLSGGLTVNQDIRLTNEWLGFIGGAANYIGSRPFEFAGAPGQGQPPPSRLVFPAYTTLNLNAGVGHDSLRVNLYVNNVTDAHGIFGVNLSDSVGDLEATSASGTQPRTIGLVVSKNF